MKIGVRSISRWPRVPPWVIGFIGLWAAVILVARGVGFYTGTELDTCLFHRLTGHPCPTCGTTRGLFAMARGAWREAFLWNPLTMAGSVLGLVVMASRILTARTLAIDLSHSEKRNLAILGLIVLGLNWVWLIRSQG